MDMSQEARAARAKEREEYRQEVERRIAALIAEAERRGAEPEDGLFVAVAPIATGEMRDSQ